jgi:hypothetical protein
MAKRYLGNSELINDIQGCHPLAEVYVIEALRHYSEQMLKVTQDEWGINSLIALDAWQDIAQETISRIEHRNEG